MVTLQDLYQQAFDDALLEIEQAQERVTRSVLEGGMAYRAASWGLCAAIGAARYADEKLTNVKSWRN